MTLSIYEYATEKRKGLLINYQQGWGEIAPLPHFSRETFEEAKEELLLHLDTLFTFKPKCASVAFGIAQCQIPFCTKPISLPLAALHTPFDGAKTLKLKLGPLSLKEALQTVQKYLGHFRLRLDFNRSWGMEKLDAFLSHFRKTDFEYLEEPAPTLKDLIAFSQNTPFPIALDESLRETGWQKVKNPQALIYKPTLLANLHPFRENMILSSCYESSIAILQIAKMGTPSTALGLDTFTDDLLEPPLKKENGRLIWRPKEKFPIRKEKLCLIAHVP